MVWLKIPTMSYHRPSGAKDSKRAAVTHLLVAGSLKRTSEQYISAASTMILNF